MTTPIPESDAALIAQLQLAFAPLHKRRFGIACGVACGALLALLTIIHLLRPGYVITADETFNLSLLRSYFAGYTVTWTGVAVGFAWGFLIGAVAGWFIAFARNLVLVVSAFLIRTRAELTRTRDFLDHI